jgi:hypothetical protein
MAEKSELALKRDVQHKLVSELLSYYIEQTATTFKVRRKSLMYNFRNRKNLINTSTFWINAIDSVPFKILYTLLLQRELG